MWGTPGTEAEERASGRRALTDELHRADVAGDASHARDPEGEIGRENLTRCPDPRDQSVAVGVIVEAIDPGRVKPVRAGMDPRDEHHQNRDPGAERRHSGPAS